MAHSGVPRRSAELKRCRRDPEPKPQVAKALRRGTGREMSAGLLDLMQG
ncbi:hypothetical protein IG631_22156 [Alternaria alternata]|nr:hypothetical protein IG631_22156 [Alternaria alternata]